MIRRVILNGLWLGLAATVTAAWAQPGVLFSETFTGPNRSAPSGWQTVNTPEGSYWYLRSGSLTSGNGDTITTQDKRTYIIIGGGVGADWRDCEIVVDAHMIQRNGGLMLIGRWQDVNNHCEGVYEVDGRDVVCRIDRVLDGRTETLGQVTREQNSALPNIAGGFTSADGRRFRMVFEGNEIAFYVDRHEILRVTDSSIASGTAGLGQFENHVFFDNFRVTGVERGVATTTVPTERPQVEVESLFRLAVAWDFSRQQARDYQRWLEDTGYIPVVLQEEPDGRYTVLTGTFFSADEARRRGDYLLSEGELLSYRVMEIRDTQQVAEEIAEAAQAPRAYAVRAGAAPSRREAEETRQHLVEDLDYFPVNILEQGGEYLILVGNFSEQSEAERLVTGLIDEDFPLARVVQVDRTRLVESTAVADTELGQDILAQMSPQDRQRIEGILSRQAQLARGTNTVEEIQGLQQLLQELRDEQSALRSSVTQIQQAAQEREARLREINAQLALAEAAIDQANWDEAEEHIAEVYRIDPEHVEASVLQRRINAAREAGRTARSGNAVQDIISRAREYEAEGNLDAAIAHLTVGQMDFRASEDIANELQRIRDVQASRLGADRAERAAQEEAVRRLREQAELNQKLILFGGIGLIALVLLLFFYRSSGARAPREPKPAREKRAKRPKPSKRASREAEEEILEEVPEGAMMPDPLGLNVAPAAPKANLAGLAAGAGGIGLDPSRAQQNLSALSAGVLSTIAAGSAPVGSPEAEPETAPVSLGEPSAFETAPPTRAPQGPPKSVSDTDSSGRVSLDFGFDEDITPAPTTEVETPSAPPEREEREELALPPLGDINFEAEPETPLEPTPVGSGTGDPFEDLGLDSRPSDPFDDALTGVPGLDETQPLPPLETAPMAAEGTDAQPDFQLGDDVFGVSTPEAEEPPLTPTAPAAEAPEEPGVFVQKFQAADAGKQPESWRGKYDFATLMVTTEHTLPDSEACLRFEKRKGAGSAFFTCRFDDVKGRVGVEFDLCCLEKNQYLLGLYFEHNENFRQSVHTVIHRANDSTSLRLQGKSHSYEFGQWVHITFRIDLKTGTVDGRVDGQPVAVNVPLLSMTEQSLPPSINTISIRDTLASEGVFLVDNIRVAKA
ncbi:hypothetical protein JXA47_10860 [Candidatus Sumerlaeota bacterium]|nr:hypothetical protein [Candidatus Sumerlaeota bacterium]